MIILSYPASYLPSTWRYILLNLYPVNSLPQLEFIGTFIMFYRYYSLGFMKVLQIFLCFLMITIFSASVSAELIIESTTTANITDGDIWSPVLSPDGDTIAYASYDNSRNQQIFTINIDGSGKKQLTNDLNRKWGIEWLKDEISFMSYDTDGIEKIFIVSLDGTNRRKLLKEMIRQGREPIKRDRFWGAGSWNEKMKTMSFTSIGKKGDEKIFQANMDGTGLKQLIDDDSRQWNPRWSPDDTSFVYISQDEKNLDQLYIVNADGTGKRQITNDTFKKYDLNWGQNGILFVSTESELASSEKIFLINPDGSGKKRLIEEGFNQNTPRWSRDGTRILYEDIDIKGNQLIKLLNLKDASTTPAITPTAMQTTPLTTVTNTPVVKKTETPKASFWDETSLVLIIGIIIIAILAILVYSNVLSKKK